MRIVSGKNKGRKINPPNNLPVRPTTDMAKESLFNILNNHVDFEEIEVLDLFAGTGNITYEFISRGCKEITSIDNNSKCIQFIKQTAHNLNFANAQVIQSDFAVFLNNTHLKWDVIFADPPYQLSNLIEIPHLVFNNQLLNQGGWLIVEHDKNISFADFPGFYENRAYGKVNFSFFFSEK
jgi:16S rRNA (guanine(966)-N(2))-methyltransferase RsmD